MQKKKENIYQYSLVHIIFIKYIIFIIYVIYIVYIIHVAFTYGHHGYVQGAHVDREAISTEKIIYNWNKIRINWKLN